MYAKTLNKINGKIKHIWKKCGIKNTLREIILTFKKKKYAKNSVLC